MHQLMRNEEELEVLIGRARDLHHRLRTKLIFTKQLKETDRTTTTTMFERRSCHLVHGNCCCRFSSYSDGNKYYNSSLLAGETETETEEERKGLAAIRDSMRDVGNCLSSLQRLRWRHSRPVEEALARLEESRVNLILTVRHHPRSENRSPPLYVIEELNSSFAHKLITKKSAVPAKQASSTNDYDFARKKAITTTRRILSRWINSVFCRPLKWMRTWKSSPACWISAAMKLLLFTATVSYVTTIYDQNYYGKDSGSSSDGEPMELLLFGRG